MEIRLRPLFASLVFVGIYVYNVLYGSKSDGDVITTETSNISDASSPHQGQQIHFRTYGDDQFIKSKKRIVQEAVDTGWFASAKALGPDDLAVEFRERFADILALPRGGGYMIWKFNLIEQAMSNLHEGDFLVYLDAGCQINKQGEKRFREYIQLVNESQYDILTFQLPSLPEYQWTSQRLVTAFGVDGQTNVTHTGQYESGDVVFQKGPHFRKWFKLCNDVINADPWMITDRYNNESRDYNPEFVDNRHDQSIMSLAWKKLGCISFPNSETYRKQRSKPFYAGRIRE